MSFCQADFGLKKEEAGRPKGFQAGIIFLKMMNRQG
jgi:hypothetical protein